MLAAGINFAQNILYDPRYPDITTLWSAVCANIVLGYGGNPQVTSTAQQHRPDQLPRFRCGACCQLAASNRTPGTLAWVYYAGT